MDRKWANITKAARRAKLIGRYKGVYNGGFVTKNKTITNKKIK